MLNPYVYFMCTRLLNTVKRVIFAPCYFHLCHFYTSKLIDLGLNFPIYLKMKHRQIFLCVQYFLIYSGPSDIRRPDIQTLQYPEDFSWEQIFLTLFCLIYPEFRVLDPDGLFLPQNAFLHYILVHFSGR